MTSTIVIDLDGTLTIESSVASYAEAVPNQDVVVAVRAWKARGFQIAIYTARNMRTYTGQVGKINANTVPTIVDWLNKHEVPFDELHVGKPWCGPDGFYVDDRCIRPSEYVSMSPEQIEKLLASEKAFFASKPAAQDT